MYYMIVNMCVGQKRCDIIIVVKTGREISLYFLINAHKQELVLITTFIIKKNVLI